MARPVCNSAPSARATHATMKIVRARRWLFLAGVLLGGMGILLALSSQPESAGRNWLSASPPVFGNRITANGICATVSFAVSNAGPRTLDFGIAWYECRAKSDLRVLATSVQTRSTNGSGYVYGMFGSESLIPLSPGTTSTVTRDFSGGTSANQARLFCGEIGWMGREPKLSGQRVDDFMIWALNIFNVTWKRHWPVKASTIGAVFISNVEVADYFRSVYGVEVNNGRLLIPSPTAYVEFAAEQAFTSFCRQSTYTLERKAEPHGPANRSQPFRFETNEKSLSAGSRR